MEAQTFILFCFIVNSVTSFDYDNVTLAPNFRQLYNFKQEHKKPISVIHTSSGEPVEVRDIFTLNTDQFTNQFHMESHLSITTERIPERIVHAKGTGAFGFFEVTHDVSEYTSADIFSKVGKKTPLFVRFSNSISSQGGTDLLRDLKGMTIKFYTDEGNLDLLCLHTPVYFYRDPNHFAALVHAFKRNPQSHLFDFTAVWDILTLRPENLHTIFWLLSDYGVPNGYRKMDAFPIHAYELSNKKGERHYVRFNFRTNQGLENLTDSQIVTIQGRDLDYYIRDLYNAIGRGDYPSWNLEMDVLTVKDVKKLDFDPFDVTRLWKNGTYRTVPVGRLVVNRHPDNHFRTVEQSAFNPAHLVPGIPGPVDNMFKGRRLFYRDTQNYRLGRNHNNILVNLPKNTPKTYLRDGVPPVQLNMKDVPNYYPNSYSGPVPYVDETRPKDTLIVLETNAVDLEPLTEFYNQILVNEGQRQRFVQHVARTLETVTPPVQERVVKMMYLIDKNLGKRVETALQAAVMAARANEG